MAANSKLRLLSLSFTLLVLFHGCLALRHRNQQRQQQKNECQINRLEALKPDNRVEYEAGVVETWNPNEDQFQCAGVAMLRITIQPNGLHLPSFSNSPRLIYIVEGEGIIGALAPGCPETYQEPQQMSPGREMRGSFQQDQHQKIRRFRRGDIIALPAGVAYWTYNDANTDVVAVSLFDVTNDANQLDQIPRRFHLAGNPRQEFQQQRQTHERQPFRERGRGRGQEQRSYNNIFAGFDAQLLAEAFNVEERLIRVLQNERDGGAIVSVRGELGVITPPRSQRFDEEEERGGGGRRGRHSEGEREREQRERRGREGRRDNGLEESICTMKIRTNIGDPSKADFYTPQAGHISTVNGVDLPILRWLQLSAEKGTLYNNAMVVPHWHPNAHSIVYVIRGTARFQVVDNMGNPVLDEEVREGQILTIPQNFAVVKQAISERFEWVALRTNCNSMTSPLAGRTSVIRGMPDEVLANAFGISREDARRLKYGNQQTHLTCGSSQMRRAIV